MVDRYHITVSAQQSWLNCQCFTAPIWISVFHIYHLTVRAWHHETVSAWQHLPSVSGKQSLSHCHCWQTSPNGQFSAFTICLAVIDSHQLAVSDCRPPSDCQCLTAAAPTIWLSVFDTRHMAVSGWQSGCDHWFDSVLPYDWLWSTFTGLTSMPVIHRLTVSTWFVCCCFMP